MGNQNPYIEEVQTTQWPKEKVQTTIYKTKDHVVCAFLMIIFCYCGVLCVGTTVNFVFINISSVYENESVKPLGAPTHTQTAAYVCFLLENNRCIEWLLLVKCPWCICKLLHCNIKPCFKLSLYDCVCMLVWKKKLLVW